MLETKYLVVIGIIIFECIVIISPFVSDFLNNLGKRRNSWDSSDNRKSSKINYRLFNCILFIALLIMIFAILSVPYIFEYMNNQERMVEMNSNSVYLIVDESPSRLEKYNYYYIDTTNKKGDYKIDKNGKRVMVGYIMDEAIPELIEIINKVVSNEENLERLTSEEKQELMHSSVYDNYRIETFDGKVYYVGDVDICLRLKDLLNNYYRRINGL